MTQTDLELLFVKALKDTRIRQSDLARASGVSQSQVSRMLSGQGQGSIQTWSLLLDAAGVEVGVRLRPLTDQELDRIAEAEMRAVGIKGPCPRT